MTTISDAGLRAAMLDTVLQGDKRRELQLINMLRDKNAEVHRINRDIKRLTQELLIVQRQIAGIHDALYQEIGHVYR